MNSALEKIVILATIIVQVLFSGCAETRTSRRRAKEEIVFQRQVISPSNIRITDKTFPKDNPNVDDLIETSENYIQYLSFRKNYSDYGDQIISNLKNNNFDATENLVKELAGKLEKDPNPYAQDYLKKVKNFNYIIYEVYETEETKPKRVAKDNSWTIIGAGPLVPVIVGITLINDIFSGGRTHLTEELVYHRIGTETKVIGKTVRKIKMTPYTGRKETLESDIPYSRLAEELKNQNK